MRAYKLRGVWRYMIADKQQPNYALSLKKRGKKNLYGHEKDLMEKKKGLLCIYV